MTPDSIAFDPTKMRELVAAFDWASTSLGPIGNWSSQVRAQVQMCLDSEHPILIALGDNLVQIYNDGYVHILADKHPSALGRPAMETWPEIKDFLAPALAGVLKDKPLTQTDYPLLLNRHGRLAEYHYTFSYSALKGSDGRVCGVMSIASDTSANVRTARRIATLDRIAETARPDASPSELWEGIRQALLKNGRDIAGAALFAHRGGKPHSISWLIGFSTARELGSLRSQIAHSLASRRQIKIRRPKQSTAELQIGDVGIALPLRAHNRRIIATLILFPHKFVPVTRRLTGFYNDLRHSCERSLEIATANREEINALRNELAEVDIRYQLLFESLGEGVICSATEGRSVESEKILAVNESCCRMLGYTNAELTGSARERIFFPDDPMLEAALLQRESFGVFRGELKLRRADGSPMWVDLTSNLMTSDAGRRQAVTIFRDATERKELERNAKLAERLEALGQLTGGVAHDFNNLLTVILGGADELTHNESLGRYERTLASLMKSAAERGQKLTGQLLAYARRQELRPRKIDINHAIENTVPLLQRLLTNNTLLKLDLGKELCFVKLDSRQFQAAMLNLVANARDAMPSGGEVRIATRDVQIGAGDKNLYAGLLSGRYIDVSVEDSGTGIPEEAITRVFEPFFTTKPVGEGTGLGLSMVQGFVVQSGGDVRIETEMGKGTSIHLIFPAMP